MNENDFEPEVWTSPGWPSMLVCGKNWMHSNPIQGAKIPTTFARIHHAVAIQLGTPPVVCYSFFGGGENSDEVWTRDAPESAGIPHRAARLALAEAWRCVDVKQEIPSRDTNIKISIEKAEFRNAAIRRNVLIWLKWGSWNSAGASFEQRRKDIENHGFVLTVKAFRRILEDAGMSI